MRRSAAALSASVAFLTGGASAAAHPSIAPPFVTAGHPATVTFVAPNERQARQTGFSVTVPAELEIVAANDSDVGWKSTVRGSTASWSGCCVAPGAIASFSLDVQAAEAPGDVRIEARQLYPNGESVRWPLPLSVLPGEKESGSALTVLLVAGLGLVVTVGVVVLFWLRRAGSLQER